MSQVKLSRNTLFITNGLTFMAIQAKFYGAFYMKREPTKGEGKREGERDTAQCILCVCVQCTTYISVRKI